MERIQRGGRPVTGFGVGVWWNPFSSDVSSSPNPAYRQTAAITGQQVDPNAPPDTLVDQAVIQAELQRRCANIPTELQAISGCSNANVRPAPGTSVSTAPASVLTLPFGGGVDANGKPIENPLEQLSDMLKWFSEHKTALTVGAVSLVAVAGGLYLAPVVKMILPKKKK